jgi:hypothetical protein
LHQMHGEQGSIPGEFRFRAGGDQG